MRRFPQRFGYNPVVEQLEDRCLLSADIVMQWNQYAIAAVQNDYNVGQTPDQGGPTRTTRALAIVQAAVYDAAVAVNPIYTPYLFSTTAQPGTSLRAAVAQAAHDTLVALFPQQTATFDQELAQSLQGISAGPAQLGEQLGMSVAAQMLAARANDGSNANMSYTPGTQPGQWRPDPLHPTQTALGAGWGAVTPFAITNPADYLVAAPPALTSPAYTAAFDYLKAIGGDGIITPTIRNPVQTIIGNFWSYDGSPNMGTPPAEYNQIMEVIAKQEGNTVMQNARLFALANLAMADATIEAWYTKYIYNYWRPVAAIRESDPGTGPSGLGDGNPNTHGDVNWTPLGAAMDNGNPNGPYFTPAFPADTSGHATIGAAMFQVLADFYGTNKIAFNYTADEYDGQTTDQYGFVRPVVARHYDTLSQAMYENAQSRLYLGIHWPWDRDGGLGSGTQIADFTIENVMLPVSGKAPRIVNLPLTPQQGRFASPLDAARGILFVIFEDFALRERMEGSALGSHAWMANITVTPSGGKHSTETTSWVRLHTVAVQTLLTDPVMKSTSPSSVKGLSGASLTTKGSTTSGNGDLVPDLVDMGLEAT